ncbi:hypothetical protein MKX29_09560 [Cytobacillus sp. FSL R7-0696]|uniref:hypothetical protein n=1 Tax=Cytobacillus sp. FSL R7-0696 TaxID=2921691 RepID=UPI0030FC8A71
MNGLVFEKISFTRDHVNAVKTLHLNNYPILYILYNEKKRPSAYIGQTVQASRRLKKHREEKNGKI